jgi:hypothetical protein
VTHGILLLYYRPLANDAATVLEHVNAFDAHSTFPVWPVNTALGFPSGLSGLTFQVIVLHYSLFGPPPVFGSWPDGLSTPFCTYLASAVDSYKIAFFQDEHHYCQERFAFLNRFEVGSVYTLLDPLHWDEVYRKHTRVTRLTHTLTGYLSGDLVERARSWVRPDEQRTIDVGYRARRLPFYMGRGGQEKADIAERFIERSRGSGLVLDIAVGEGSRIYGDSWWTFLANCRGVLGVEAGVSVFDLDGSARAACDALLRTEPRLTFEDVAARVLFQRDGRIQYRTISPRHFEAAALRVTQILFEGTYNGVLEPWKHYLPLKKDFSNYEEVVAAFHDPTMRTALTDRTYSDVVESGRWTYERFIAGFDHDLVSLGFSPRIALQDKNAVTRRLQQGSLLRRVRGRVAAARHMRFPGRARAASAMRRLLDRSTKTTGDAE